MIKWTIINIYLLLLTINNKLIFREKDNYDYNNILTLNKNSVLFSNPFIKLNRVNSNIIKRSYHNNTSLNNKLVIVQKDTNDSVNKISNLEIDNFYKWLVGFTDGDGSFYIKNLEYGFKLIYGFHLHKDDLQCLENIKNNLNILNNISIRELSIQLTVYNKQWIYDNLLPIFDKYPCITIKYYSYIKWREVLIKSINNVSSKELIKNKLLINNYEIIDNIEIPYNNINDHWILGFLEAEGSFLINNTRNSCRLFISQHEQSKKTLEVIKDYILNNWKPIDSTPIFIKEDLLNNWDNIIQLSKLNKCNVINLAISNLDFLYYVIIPKLNSINWYTIKYNSFINWQSIINIYIKGLHKINNNNVIQEYIEHLRNLNKKGANKINYNIELYNKIINNNKPLYNMYLSYRLNSLTYKTNKFIGVGVYVYDLNNLFIIRFSGLVNAGLHFNCSKHMIDKYVKNGNVFINKYILLNIYKDSS